MLKITIEIDEKIFASIRSSDTRTTPAEMIDPLKLTAEEDTNFSFEVKVGSGAKLTLINIDGEKVEGRKLIDLANAAVDGVIKGELFVPLLTNEIFVIIDAVGEPGIELQLASLKFLGKDVIKKAKPFQINGNRRGQLSIDTIELPKP